MLHSIFYRLNLLQVVDILMGNDGVVIDDELSVSYFTTPLAIATLHGRDAFLRTLLRKGVPPDQNFKHTQWTPLMIAALTG